MKSSLLRKVVIGTFLSVPMISSIISTIHLIDLFNLGNPTWLSILLAVTFELGSIASLLAISVIEKIKVGAIWFIFFILSGLQIIGNIYYSYSFTSDQILANPVFLTNFMDLFSFITGDEIKDVKIFLSCIIGIPIPLIALFFLKSNIDYLKPEKNKDAEPVPVKEETKPQPIEEAPLVEQDVVETLDDKTDDEQPLDEQTWYSENDGRDDTPLNEEDNIEEKESPNGDENMIIRRSSRKNSGRYIFDERGVKHYNA